MKTEINYFKQLVFILREIQLTEFKQLRQRKLNENTRYVCILKYGLCKPSVVLMGNPGKLLQMRSLCPDKSCSQP